MTQLNKHAYLIIAHSNNYVLEKLILLLDDERNDIFIHVDKKTKDFDFEYYQGLVDQSSLIFTPRIDVRWGHVSLIEAELTLFETALARGEYSYYHLLSGADLPLKSQSEISHFFEKHKGREFLGYSDDVFELNRVSKIHLFPKYMRVEEHQWLMRMGRKLRNLFLSLQQKLGCNFRRSFKGELKYGTQWASLTHCFIKELVNNKKFFLQFYKYSNCADEIYKHTFAFNSQFRDSIYCLDDELKGCQRLIDWHRGRPYTFQKDDFAELMKSPFLFARKFDDEVDKDIVDLIYNELKA